MEEQKRESGEEFHKGGNFEFHFVAPLVSEGGLRISNFGAAK
jgi:hypothetical protein